jgi:hypothetical protein
MDLRACRQVPLKIVAKLKKLSFTRAVLLAFSHDSYACFTLNLVPHPLDYDWIGFLYPGFG